MTIQLQVVVDDTDPGITYSGSWSPDHGSLDNIGNSGIPYLHTLHKTTSNTSFAYTFQGTSFFIVGTFLYDESQIINNQYRGPTWDCYLDGEPIRTGPDYLDGIFGLGSPNTNNVVFCSEINLADGAHTIVVQAHVPESGNTSFWFDYLRYQPSASVELDKAVIYLEPYALPMQFVGWSEGGDALLPVTKPGATFTFDFIGISLTWYERVHADANVTLEPTTATYTIDGGAPTTFVLNGASGGSEFFFQLNNQVVFQTPTLPAGPHTLVVDYLGDSNTVPLHLQYLLVQNGTSSTTPTPSANQDSKHSTTSHIGPIVGGVVGALALIVATIALFLFLRRRANHSRQEEASDAMEEIISRSILPYSLDGNTQAPASASSPRKLGSPSIGNPGKHNIPAIAGPSTGQQASTSMDMDNYPTRGRHDNYALDPLIVEPFDGGSLTAARLSGELPRPRITQDEDSGIRIRQTNGGEVVVLPPVYTAS